MSWIDFRIFEEVPIARAGEYSIVMENTDTRHRGPHLHLKKKGVRLASVAIRDGEILAGSVPRRVRQQLLDWIESHRDRLLKDWNLMGSGIRPRAYDDFDP